MNKTLVPLREEYITLGQLLKLIGAIPTGGAVRAFLTTTTVYVNGEPENRRGRKLYPGDTVTFDGRSYQITKGEHP
ncbi:S4 domain protein YaaA [Chthonomonas calidirosea]|uniref:S4 domain protein YaaA n=1 Tax=Chthonomonas calidirosea (strain DSM 23976 / ICMP 18418 / T49) TaxID=1303518 RepID=S0EUB9_CHTCT|nr:S4 domain protein YaaA [Chthonomonas calidirosea T49]CEK20699.1 S4 domain protein YaaA [Chthonomonas calidirosea]